MMLATRNALKFRASAVSRVLPSLLLRRTVPVHWCRANTEHRPQLVARSSGVEAATLAPLQTQADIEYERKCKLVRAPDATIAPRTQGCCFWQAVVPHKTTRLFAHF